METKPEPDVKALQKQNREYKKALKILTRTVKSFIELLDAEMKKPSSFERGKRIASWCNAAEMTNDKIRHFTLREKL
jgi:hypothetical protein